MASMKILASVGCAALLGLAACESTDQASTAVKSAVQAQTTPTLSTADATFINTAAQAGLEEVKFGQLATTKTHNKRVRAFAEQMVSDHTQANQKLMAIAQAKGITPTSTMDTMHDQLYSQLQGEHGRSFNRDYLAAQLKDHQTVVQMFQDEAQNGTDPDVKNFAAQTLPILQHHLDELEKMQPKT